jgi:phosphoenolpyruvate phosphomutase
MHSAKTDPSEIKAFCDAWKNKLPVVIVPTKYYKTPTEEFKKWGISTVIWANHNLRAAVKVMQETSKKIFTEQTLVGVEDNIASVKEVFRLQNEKELGEAEKKYL